MIEGKPIHKAEPDPDVPDRCRGCGQPFREVPGGQGMTRVHEDGYVVAADRLWFNDRQLERLWDLVDGEIEKLGRIVEEDGGDPNDDEDVTALQVISGKFTVERERRNL